MFLRTGDGNLFDQTKSKFIKLLKLRIRVFNDNKSTLKTKIGLKKCDRLS